MPLKHRRNLTGDPINAWNNAFCTWIFCEDLQLESKNVVRISSKVTMHNKTLARNVMRSQPDLNLHLLIILNKESWGKKEEPVSQNCFWGLTRQLQPFLHIENDGAPLCVLDSKLALLSLLCGR